TDDPEFAPEVNSLSLEFDEVLVSEALGRIEPQTARPNAETRFTYTLVPRAGPNDGGFDLLRFGLPGAVDLQSVDVRASSGVELSTETAFRGDSLLVTLPEPVRDDSIRVSFNTRLIRNATLFALDLGSSAHPDLWQSVEPATRRANIVMLPELTGSTRLIDDLRLSSPVVTPNGDGINDQLRISFVTFKIEGRTPQARIYDLAGRMVAELAAPAVDGAGHVFTWSGRNTAGAVVPTGAYVLRLELGADAGEDTVLRNIAVAY
ncbi:MAG: gliding motility-associated C-terminal domain-containing protein, partial [Candidatus Latescibacteria bacterium]|nr:gliding motility-associated C-terminal domain-containing protein [Candidatus Latescibacterota bacterium]